MAAQDRMTPRTVYLHAVCLIMLLVGLGALVLLVRGAIAIASPQDIVGYAWTPSQDPIVIEGVDERFLSPEQRAEWDSHRRNEIIGTVTAGVTLLLAGWLFVLHWRRAQADRAVPTADEVPAAAPAP